MRDFQKLKAANGAPMIKRVTWNGVQIHLYSIGWLSFHSKMAQVTLRLWQRQKVLPEPVMQLPGSVRWYSAPEVILFSQIIGEHYTSGRDRTTLIQRLSKASSSIASRYKALSPATRSKFPLEYLALPKESDTIKAFEDSFNQRLELRKTHIVEITQKQRHENRKDNQGVQGAARDSKGLAPTNSQAEQGLPERRIGIWGRVDLHGQSGGHQGHHRPR